jgi:hypothetical protein
VTLRKSVTVYQESRCSTGLLIQSHVNKGDCVMWRDESRVNPQPRQSEIVSGFGLDTCL